MKKSEYLPFHAKVLFSVSADKKPIYWHFSEAPTNVLTEYDYSGDHSRKKINTEEELLNAINNGAKPPQYGLHSLKHPYLKEVLLNGSQEQIKFFVSNNKSLIGDFYLSDINNLIPKMSEESIFTVFSFASNTMGRFAFTDFEKTGLLLKDHPNAAQILYKYLSQREKVISNEYSWISIRNTLIKYFSKDLEVFRGLPLVTEYLDSLKHNENPFLETDISQTIYLRIDCGSLKKSYPLPFGSFQFYTSSLKTLFKCFEKNCEQSGVVKIHINESMLSKTEYQYSHVYVNLNEKSQWTKEYIKELVHDYYGNFLKEINDENSISNLDLITDKWLKTKILEDDLTKDTNNNKNSTTKRMKI